MDDLPVQLQQSGAAKSVGEGLMLRAFYMALGVVVARWIFRRRLDADTLTRLRSVGGI